jgi:hypothetical protein
MISDRAAMEAGSHTSQHRGVPRRGLLGVILDEIHRFEFVHPARAGVMLNHHNEEAPWGAEGG